MLFLDLKILKDYELSLDEFLALTKLHLNYEIESVNINNYIESLQSKNFIKIINNHIVIREKTLKIFKIVQDINMLQNKPESKKTTKSDLILKHEIDSFIEEFRNKWKGLKPGSMGSLEACKNKMLRWWKNNPNYTKEEILNAAETYLKSLDNLKYLQQADYFIYKKEGLEETSRLSAFIDEGNSYSNDDWTVKMI